MWAEVSFCILNSKFIGGEARLPESEFIRFSSREREARCAIAQGEDKLTRKRRPRVAQDVHVLMLAAGVRVNTRN